jgi:glycine cleavage system H lipoate-binding protein/ABC-type phosphate transport system substrate-binding protein
MKTKISLLTSLSLLLSCLIFSNVQVSGEKPQYQAVPFKVYCSPELQGLASGWTSVYSKLTPGSQIDLEVVSQPGTGLLTGNNLAFVSEREMTGDEYGWKMVVGREIIIPIINTGNPFVKELNEKGVKQDMITRLIMEPGNQVWGNIVENRESIPVHFYVSNDNTVITGVESFLGIPGFMDIGIKTWNELEVIAAVQNDPYAVGFCKITSLLDFEKQSISHNIQLLPIDKNGNGKLDNMEKIYDDLNVFARGVWIGKYPKALSNDIYAVSTEQPSAEAQTAFLKWVLTDGQQFLALNGFSDLVYSEVQSKLERFTEIKVNEPVAGNAYSTPKLVLFILIAFIVIGIMLGAILGYGRNREVPVMDIPVDLQPAFDEHSLMAPKGLHYDKSHTWAFMEKDGAVRIGIDDFLQNITGPITRIEMKKPGEKITKGELLVSIIQKGKQLKLYAPVSGKIQECNTVLLKNSYILNASPYSDGWIYKIEPENWSKEIPLLSMEGKYSKWISEEIARLRDFLAHTLQSHKLEYANVVLQDGGMLKNNLLEDLGPEVWEDFQTNFLDADK